VKNQRLHATAEGTLAAVRPLLLASLALLLAACGGDDGDSAPAAATSEAGPCELARPKKAIDPPEGLIAPEGIEVEDVEPLPPNQKVTGFLPLTPSQFIAGFERDKRLGILFKEDEGKDAEMMVTDAKQRSFWKLTLACPEGSRFTVLTGEELAPAAARRAIRRHARGA
jgi:hypothetical protein